MSASTPSRRMSHWSIRGPIALAAMAGTCLAGAAAPAAAQSAQSAHSTSTAAVSRPHPFGALPPSQVHVVVRSHSGMAVGGRAAPCAHKSPGESAHVVHCQAMIATGADGRFLVDPAHPLLDGYGPADLQSAYNLDSSAGSGKTIAIVDAYGDSAAESDLATFRTQFDLPPCTTANGCFTKLDENGGTDYPADDQRWALETALDLAAVSATCPLCHITLVEASTNSTDDSEIAENTAAEQPGVVAISNSFGGPEWSLEGGDDVNYNHPGIAIIASSGDVENYVLYPSTSPYVLAAGGTTLTRDPNAPRGWDESVWGDGHTGGDGVGSGCSAYEPRPGYQSGIDTECPNNKATVDMSADANPDTGLAVFCSIGCGGWVLGGGTSLSSPLIAGMVGLAATPMAGTTFASYPYTDSSQSSDLNDVTSGSNGECGTVLCNAGPGWDGPTGLGTPDGVGALQTYAAPHFTSAAHARFAMGVQSSFTVTTAASPTPTLSDGGATLPDGITFIDNGDGTATLAGTPDAGTEGVYLFTITASNGLDPDATQHFRLIVTAPVGAAEWVPQGPTASPPGLVASVMADDPAGGGALLFGGQTTDGVDQAQTWEWDGYDWTQLAPATSPSARDCAAAAYDAATGQLVLFGGESGADPLGDTWVWDGSDWTQLNPATSPPALACASMAYDAESQQIVLFGGADSARAMENGTWTWDGSTWTQQSPAHSPSARDFAAMADDAADGYVVLFGGSTDAGSLGDTWTWDGSDWTQQTPAHSPDARDAASGFYDSARSDVVVFGGLGPSGWADDTWAWDGDDWSQQQPADSPAARGFAQAAYDSTSAQGVVFGGLGVSQVFADTWLMGPPSAPTGLQTASGQLSVSLVWDAPTTQGDSAVSGYEIFRGTATGAESASPLATVDGSTLAYDDTSALPGTTYYYTVRAINGSGASMASVEASGEATTAATQTAVASDPAAPVFGQPVAFVATVTPGVQDGPAPTGTVTFIVDGTQLGVPVDVAADGTATSDAVPGLAPGDHDVQAVYSGDANYDGSQGDGSTTVGCERTITGQRGHSLLVKDATCVVDATVSGWIHVRPGGAIAVMNSTLGGELTSTKAAAVLVCGSTLLSPVTVTGSTGPVTLAPNGADCGAGSITGVTNVSGNAAGVLIGGVRFGGQLTVHGNSVSVVVTDSQVKGRAIFSANIAANGTTISANTFVRRLVCRNNNPPPGDGGSPNQIGGHAIGQCAGLGGAVATRHMRVR